MYRSQHIMLYGAIFSAATVGLVVLSYLISLLGFMPYSENLTGMSLIIFFVALLSTVIPIAFLKAISFFSRRVKKDDSHFDMRHFADPSEPTQIR